MKREDDVSRLEHSSEDAVLRRALGAARRDLPDDARMRRLSLALSAKLADPGVDGSGGPAPADGAAGASAGSAGGVGLAKAAGVVLALAIAGGLIHAARKPSPAPPPAVTTAASVAASVTPPPAEEIDPVPTVSVEDLPVLAPSASAKPRESELELLRRAQSALGSDPARALAIVGDHQRLHPRSAYGQEREVLAIEALVRLGRRSEAVARADRFAAAFPKSAHNRRIDALLGR
jgi:hypothetical protein